VEQHVNHEDLRRMREAQRATTGAQAKMLVKIRVRPFRPKLSALATVRYGLGTEVDSFAN
jgi:hypothetical protein